MFASKTALTAPQAGESPFSTTTVNQSFSVDYAFDVTFTSGLFQPENTLFRDTLRKLEPSRRHRFLVFIDSGIASALPDLPHAIAAYARHHAQNIEMVTAPVRVTGGEEIKFGLEHVIEMQRLMVEHHIDRHSFIVAIGGGAVLDAVGLAAATAHRGIRHIRVPTTVLSQNDSGVGVKNGVNLFGSKNFYGTFVPPFAVLNDIDFISGLPERDRLAGMAEAVKVALIRDSVLFCWLERNVAALAAFETGAMAYMIQRCAELHMKQIGQGGDPFESGAARPLDFGHWAAHRLEVMTEFAVRHGEAVAIGIALDTEYSVLAGLLDRASATRVEAVLTGLGFTLWHPALLTRDASGLALMRGIVDFREHLGGELTVTLLDALGVGVEVHDIASERMLEALTNLETRHSGQ